MTYATGFGDGFDWLEPIPKVHLSRQQLYSLAYPRNHVKRAHELHQLNRLLKKPVFNFAVLFRPQNR